MKKDVLRNFTKLEMVRKGEKCLRMLYILSNPTFSLYFADEIQQDISTIMIQFFS